MKQKRPMHLLRPFLVVEFIFRFRNATEIVSRSLLLLRLPNGHISAKIFDARVPAAEDEHDLTFRAEIVL